MVTDCVTPPTQMTRRSLPGEATSPSSSSPPSFPAAATTKIPLAVASLTESSMVRPDDPRSGNKSCPPE